MKKQIDPTIKAHLIRSAFYVLLLLAVCVIPFALAQRNTKQRIAKPTANLAAAGKQAGAPASLVGAVQKQLPYNGPKFPYSSVRDRGTLPESSAVAPKRVSQLPALSERAPGKPGGVPATPRSQFRKISSSPAGVICTDYTFTLGTATFVPGVDDIGSHCDDCDTAVALPFPVTLYDQTYTTAMAGSNGHLTFGIDSASFGITCSPFGVGGTTYAQGPYWGDQCTGACASITCDTCGIFTTTIGTAPNRVFYIEWRTQYYNQAQTLNYEVALYENGTPPFQYIYNTINAAGLPNDSELVVGVKKDDSTFTQYGCDPSGGQAPPVSSGQALTASCAGGGTPTPTPTGTPGGCQFHVLIVYADSQGLPSQLQSEIQAEPNVISVDLFDATVGTPTLGQLQQYEIVVPFSNSPFLDGDTLGNNLADYVDGGGIVVQYGFSFYGPGQPYGVNGRWISGNYNAYNYSTNLQPNAFTLGTFNAGHPLMAGVTTLNSNFGNIVTLAAGATEVAQDNLGDSLVAYRPVSGGHTTVGVTAYVGAAATQSGDWGKVIVNAGNWLANCQGVTPTPTPTPTCTPGAGGLLIGSGMTTGYLPNGWEPTLASNTVNYTFANSQAAPNEFALFDTHDAWGFTVIKDAITSNGHTYTEFTPAQLAGFPFSDYRVIILNWDDTVSSDFIADYSAAIPALEAYINAGGVVWVTAAIQSCDSIPMPFGGQGNGCDFGTNDPVVDPASPMMVGMPNPIPGDAASHLSFSGLPGGAHIVVTSDASGQPALYDLRPGGGCGSPTPTPTATATCPPQGGAGVWNPGTPYPTTIVRYGFAQTATHFYVFGGVDNGAITTAVNRMDLSTGNWEPRAAMPTAGGEAPTCALDESAGMVYCTDGTNGSGFFSYNIASDSWATLASIPESDTYGSASGAFNGKVFVAGGTGGISNAVWVYDIGLNSWSAGTAAPALFLLAGYHQLGQFLYVVGGFDPTFVNNATTWRLDMSSAPGVWDVGPVFTPQRADFGLAYDAGANKLYALAGDLPNDGNPFNSTNLVDELDLSGWPGGTWNPSPPDMPPQNRQANQAGFYGNGDIWSVGGINGATFVFTNEVWHRNNGGGCASPTPTATATPTATFTPTATATATFTPTATATATPTATATATATATPTATPTATATATATPTATASATVPPRPPPTPRPFPTPPPRP